MNTALMGGRISTSSARGHWTLGFAAFAVAAIVSFALCLSLGRDAGTNSSVPAPVRMTSLAAYGPQSVAPADAASPAVPVTSEFYWCTPGILTPETLDLLTSFNICQPH